MSWGAMGCLRVVVRMFWSDLLPKSYWVLSLMWSVFECVRGVVRLFWDDSVSEGLPSSEYGRGVLLSTLHYDSEACVKRH